MRVPLTGGAYTARSVVAAAQRQLNLYSEPMPQQEGEPASFACYPFPGLRKLIDIGQGPIRGMRHATNDTLYVCAGSGIYAMVTTPGTGQTQGDTADYATWSFLGLGTITAGKTTPVSMTDNGLQLVIVDGSPNGWTVTLANNAFAPIVDATGSFRGADRATYLDTFFLFNVPGTPQFQCSLSLSTTFDPLYFANKESFSDLLVTVVVAKREIWLLGTSTTEVWYNTGAAAFPFESMPGVFIDRGIVAKYSAAELDNAVYWLGQDRYGAGIVMMGAGYQSTRISTFAIEAELATYPTLADAIGMSFEIAGHLFYVLTFPTADKTWCYDIGIKLWNELCWLDGNGSEHRHRMNCSVYANGQVIVGDWQSGVLYELDLEYFTDAGAPIKRLRSFPHLLEDGKRIFYRQLLADIETGTGAADVAITRTATTGYQLMGVDYPVYINADGSVTGVTAPTSFRYALASVWLLVGGTTSGMQLSSMGRAGGIEFAVGFGGSSGSLSVQWSNGTTDGSAAFPGLSFIQGLWHHCIWSVDTLAGTAQFYVNDVPQPLGTVLGPCMAGSSGYMVVQASTWGPNDTANSNPGGGVQGDCYLALTDAFYDLSLVENRRKFIGASGEPIDLGVNGSMPTGEVPMFFLRVRPGGVASDYMTNSGSGGGSFWTPGIEGASGPTGGTQKLYTGSATPPVVTTTITDGSTPANLISLAWSNDRGHSFGSPVMQSLGAGGEYLKSLQWQRLGLARDRVYQISWSSPVKTVLQGAWIIAEPAQS